MAFEENQGETPLKQVQSIRDDAPAVSSTDSRQKLQPNNISPPKKNSKEFILSVARKFAAQPLENADPGVWGVLTAISANARKRSQGMNILLTDDEHCIGRLATESRFRIESPAVSGNHCKVYRKKVSIEDMDQPSSSNTAVFLMDTSTNGTYLNWDKLKKNSPGSKIQHGDIVSFSAVPQHEAAYAFVYREVLNPTALTDGATMKRKAEELGSESKRLKGIGVGAPEGPISLDDVRSLQRSNTELRKQLESQAIIIEELREENRTAVARHENEMKELKESISHSYLGDIKELRHTLDVKQKELNDISMVSAERQQAIEDLNERLSASVQSRSDAAEIISCQKATISELEKQLDEERNQRREEREKAVADKKAALQRAHSEAQEELNRQCDVASRREREFKEVINKLQESDKENRQLVGTLSTKLEDIRESLVIAEKKVRQVECQIQEEQQVSANNKQKVESLEYEKKRLMKELENEKVAREEAWAKVSALELQIAAAVREISAEKQRYQDARERIILRETQLRAFYSTTEEITALFAKQQEQLKAMQKTLEDEDNYENTFVSNDLNVTKGNTVGDMIRENEINHVKSTSLRENSTASTPRVDRIQVDSTSSEASATEKHDCDMKSQEGCRNTQDIECTSMDRSVKGGFGSDIDGVGTAPILEGDHIDTERVVGTESQVADVDLEDRNFDLNKSNTLAGDTMQLDDEAQLQENGEEVPRVCGENARCSQSNDPREAMEDTEAARTMRTSDLLASELPGSWAITTDPSVQGENDSPGSRVKDSVTSDDEAEVAHRRLSDGQAAGSQTVPTTFVKCSTTLSQEQQAMGEMVEIQAAGSQIVPTTFVKCSTTLSQERQASGEMIEIVEPDRLNKLFGGEEGRDNKGEASATDSDIDGSRSNHDDGDDNGVDDTQAASDLGDEDDEVDAMDADSEDSLS